LRITVEPYQVDGRNSSKVRDESSAVTGDSDLVDERARNMGRSVLRRWPPRRVTDDFSI